MKRLIVTADDVGLDRGMTAGAIRAHREGIVTACSIVAAGREFDDAVARLRDVPSLEAGVHLTLVEERSLTGVRLPKHWTRFLPRYAVGGFRRNCIERELRAQIEKVLGAGLKVTHLNGHQHLHLLPRIFGAVVALAEQYGIPYIRIVDDRGGKSGLLRRAAVSYLGSLGREARSQAPKTNDRTIGVAEAGRIAEVEPLLDQVEGITELVTHPGMAVAGYAHWRYRWDEETRALCAPGLREAITRRGIELIAPSAA